MLRVRPGNELHTLADGRVLHLDRRLSREQLDVVLAVCAAADVDTAVVAELEVSEVAGWRVTVVDPDAGSPDDPDWPLVVLVGRTLVVQH